MTEQKTVSFIAINARDSRVRQARPVGSYLAARIYEQILASLSSLKCSGYRIKALILLGLVFLTCLGLSATALAQERNPAWATPLAVAGLPNLHKVTDNLYRSAQPTAEGLHNAEKMGITTVLNLRAWHGDARLAKGANLKLVRVKINTWNMDEEDIFDGLREILNARGPFLVHCQHGADRTGTLMAAYRMVVQGWPPKAAIEELAEGGYGYHTVWGNLITLLENLNVAQMRTRLQRATTPPGSRGAYLPSGTAPALP